MMFLPFTLMIDSTMNMRGRNIILWSTALRITPKLGLLIS